MARLIDADELIEIAHRIRLDSRERIEQMIESAPTVDIDAITESHEQIGYDKGFRDGYAEALEVTDENEPKRHGQWIISEDRYFKTCSKCGAEVDVSMGLGIFVDGDEVDEMNYCPSCGAIMDEDRDYEHAVEQLEHNMTFEPTYNTEDGSM